MTTYPALSRPAPFAWGKWLLMLVIGAAVLFYVAQLAMPLAAALFIVLYVAMAYSQPEAALMVVLASAPFPYDVSPGFIPVNFSMSELSLILCAGVLMIKQMQGARPMRFGPILLPALVYLAICGASGVVSYHGNATVKSILQMCVYFVAAVGVFASMVDSKHRLMPALYALLAVGCFQAVLTLMGMTYSIGIHKNAAGASLAGIFVVAFELWFQGRDRRTRVILTPVLLLIGAGLLMSLSRGAWVGAFLGCFGIMLLRREMMALIKLSIIGIPVILICFASLDPSTVEYVTQLKPAGHNSITHRYDNAAEFWSHFTANPLIGSGTGIRKLVDATNVVLSTLAETGVLGLAAFAWIFIVFFRMVWWAHKRVARNDPLFSLLAIGTGLMLARLGHGMFDHYWSRGALTAAWSAAGMATLAYLTVRAREARRRAAPARVDRGDAQ
ncbi:MAG: hypothetical protein GVY24_03200 [Planctomycetes bacterium]|jgi:hypothetical protein|nr:hypothetical protein [Planctomycetota bacterium]